MARIACDLSDILDATKALLVDAGVFTDKQCFISLEPDEILTAAKVEAPMAGLTFVAFSQRPDTFHCEMDPGDDPTVEGDLVVAIWMQSGEDQPGRDKTLLTHPVTGASQLVRQVFTAINNVDLVNADGDTLLWRTFNYTGVAQRGRWSKDKRWRRIDVRFNCNFSWQSQETFGGGRLIWADPAFESALPTPAFS